MYGCMRERMGAADWCVAAPPTIRFRFQTDNWLKVLTYSTLDFFLRSTVEKESIYFFFSSFTHSAALVNYLLDRPVSIY